MKTNTQIVLFNKTVGLIMFLFSVIVFPSLSSGQDNSDIDPELTGEKQDVAPVKLDGHFLFNVRGISSFPAEQRAATIIKRIKSAAEDTSISADSVNIVSGAGVLKIFAGKEFIMNVYDIDAGSTGISRNMFAELIDQKTKTAINTYRFEHSKRFLFKKSIYAVGAAVLLIIVLLFFLWLIRRLNIALQNKIKIKVDTVENISFKLIRSHQLWKAFHLLFKIIRIIVIVIVVAIFIQYILGLFPWTNNIATSALELFLNPLKIIGKEFIAFLPSLAFLIVIFFVTRYLLKLIKILFVGVHDGGIVIKNFDPEWALPTFKILRIFIIAFAVIIAFPYIPGSGSSAFKGVTVFLGILFSLGSSSFISNIIAGYSMTYRRAFKKGDRIKINEYDGFVEEQKLLVTRFRSLKNEEILIPNSVLLNSTIINYTVRAKEIGLIIHTTVGIGYETPWRQVDEMLKLAADRTEGLLKEPPPFVLKQSLGDFAVNYEINAYCFEVSQIHLFYTRLHQNILDVFNENNVQIMTPSYVKDPETPKVVPKDQWNTPLANEK